MYIREPAICEIPYVIEYSDISLNSELETLIELDREAKKQNRVHKVILMCELGHIREGASKEEVEFLAGECLKLENINLYGIGTNPSCYTATMPTVEEMVELVELTEKIEKKYNIKIEIISGGNSTSYDMLIEGKLPKRINNLRMGESVFLGVIPCIERPIEGFNQDNFMVKAQIVEIKDKASVPRDPVVGNGIFESVKPDFEDMGLRKKALVAIGKQDIGVSKIKIQDPEIVSLRRK